jgi:hypothetical protein
VRYDATLKNLFTHSARGLFRTLTGSTPTEWLNVEMPRVNARRLDLLGRFRNGELWNIEFQATNDAQMAERAGGYYLETRIRTGEHVEQIILYLGKEPMRMNPSIDTPSMQFKFRLMDIGELDGDALAANGDLGDAMLAILARVKSRQQAIRRVLDRIAKLKGKAREVAIEQLAIIAGLRGLEVDVIEEARKYMPFVVDLMENKIYRARYERGLAAGRTEGRLETLRLLLKKRFGRLPAWAQKRLDGATTEQLETWTLKVLDASTLEDVLGKR